MHAAYLSGCKDNSTMFNGDLYQLFPYDLHGITTVHFAGELEMPALLDSGCGVFSIVIETYL